LFLLGITNAINLSDGLDRLAGGVTVTLLRCAARTRSDDICHTLRFDLSPDFFCNH
jgi:hypothetical protein